MCESDYIKRRAERDPALRYKKHGNKITFQLKKAVKLTTQWPGWQTGKLEQCYAQL